MTNDLFRRIVEHKNGLVPGFTSRYRIHRLVHFESFVSPREAIAREKQIKAWDRKKRIVLIERTNPAWTDLAETWVAKPKTNADPSPHGGSG